MCVFPVVISLRILYNKNGKQDWNLPGGQPADFLFRFSSEGRPAKEPIIQAKTFSFHRKQVLPGL